MGMVYKTSTLVAYHSRNITHEGMDLKDMHICGSRNHPDVGQGSMSGNFNHYLQGF